MAQQAPFKQYERGGRIQLTETDFSGGMSYTNIPLTEGLSKLLVNMNISDDGSSLSPRDGLRNYQTSEPGPQTSFETLHRSQLKISDCAVVHKEDNTSYHHVVLSEYDGTNCTLRHMRVDDNVHEFLGASNCQFHKEDIPSIHGVPIVDTDIVTPTGTFAFNNDYYYFGTDGYLRHTKYDLKEKTMSIEMVDSPEVSPRDVPTPGYNMLAKSPYEFVNGGSSDLARTLIGIVCYKVSGEGAERVLVPVLDPVINTEYLYVCYYENYQTGDTIKWEWKEAGADGWNVIDEHQFTDGSLEKTFTCPAREFMIRVTCTDSDDIVTSQLAKLYTMETDPTRKSKFENYDLSTTKNLVYWKRRLVIGGVAEDRSILFMSLPDEPGYFPYPTWTDQFDEPIMNVVPFMESLLVFTSTKLYQIMLDEAGTFTKICLQEHLNIAVWDKHLTQIIKNMLFFKSGNYYYMVVPRAGSMTGELTIAPISKNMKEFFDSFPEAVAQMMKDVYSYEGPLELTNYYNFLDYESIYNVYMYKVQENLYFNVCLLYNSVKRYWKINVYESATQLVPLIQDATKSGVLIQLNFNSRELSQSEQIALETTQKYIYRPQLEYFTHDHSSPVDTSEMFKNFQYIDTGYREHTSDLKKRYRELQLVIDNPSCQNIKIYPSFYIDGDTRQQGYRYEPVYNEQERTITMNKVPVNPMEITGNTILDLWELDLSEFPSTTVWKLRVPVSGKGYCPRLAIFSENEVSFKIIKMTWVSRTMNSR